MSVTDVTITPLLSLPLQLCPAAANKEAAPKQKVQGSCSDVCQQRTGGGGGGGGWVGGFAELQEGGTTTTTTATATSPGWRVKEVKGEGSGCMTCGCDADEEER